MDSTRILLLVLLVFVVAGFCGTIYLAFNFNRLVQSWFLKEEARRRGATSVPVEPVLDEFEKPRHWYEDPNVTRPNPGPGD